MTPEEIYEKVQQNLSQVGFEFHVFKVGWYNDKVKPEFHLNYEYDTMIILVLSTPDMFDKAFKPYLLRTDCLGVRDPIDECMTFHFKQMKECFQDIEIESIHDFEMDHNRRPKILVQTAGHVAGAAYYYQRSDVDPDPWSKEQKIFGVSIHPKYGGWFAFRGVLIFKNIMYPDLEQKKPVDSVPSLELRKELLERFNFHWQDWSFRDIFLVEKKYSEEQKEYFGTEPKNRAPLVERMRKGI
ncbi:hypothetical protein CHS0354_010630 [Potamilus streckersoni]|uniref:Cyanocobalamin reductase (cyanide-eliminating) n=1 Tax=Potamilus streckersoni TaxID=2493646 RepID=A0AAE0SH29_9BIVA|nr:hypothetical protein CHS0354_010630 [Potamilus streckersoni]